MSSDLGRWGMCVVAGKDAKWLRRVVKKVIFPSHCLLPNHANLLPVSSPLESNQSPSPVMNLDVWLRVNKIEFLKTNTPEPLNTKGCVSASLHYLERLCLPSFQYEGCHCSCHLWNISRDLQCGHMSLFIVCKSSFLTLGFSQGHAEPHLRSKRETCQGLGWFWLQTKCGICNETVSLLVFVCQLVFVFCNGNMLNHDLPPPDVIGSHRLTLNSNNCRENTILVILALGGRGLAFPLHHL